MEIIEVVSKKDSNQFISFPVSLYKNEEVWIRPIDKEVEHVFDPKFNPAFENGICKRWLLKQNGSILGRIAAFTSDKVAPTGEISKVSGIGFFDCVNDQEAADMLFDTSREWLAEQGCDHMDGPINFGKRDRWWGLLTKGFELEPNYQFNYNFPYYKELFEQYGFQVYYEHYTFRKYTQEMVHEKLRLKAEMVNQDPDYKVVSFDKSNFDKQIADVVEIYNKAWVNHEGVSQITLEQGRIMFKKLKPILDERIMWMAYYKDQPVGFYLNMPEVNQLFKHVDGKMGMLGTLKFLWFKLKKKNEKMLGMVFGVIPEHQGKGVDGALVMSCYNALKKLPGQYDILEIAGIGDFNRKMLVVVKQVGGDVCKVHSTYRYQFDRSLPFERMKPI